MYSPRVVLFYGLPMPLVPLETLEPTLYGLLNVSTVCFQGLTFIYYIINLSSIYRITYVADRKSGKCCEV